MIIYKASGCEYQPNVFTFPQSKYQLYYTSKKNIPTLHFKISIGIFSFI